MAAEVWVQRITVQSMSDMTTQYVVARKADGSMGCSCPKWIFQGKPRRDCKHILALLLIASIWDTFSLPILVISPFLFEPSGVGTAKIVEYVAVAWLGSDIFITLPVVLYGARKRSISLWWTLANFPLIWVTRTFNFWYSSKALLWEFFLVPLGWAKSLDVWHKGH